MEKNYISIVDRLLPAQYIHISFKQALNKYVEQKIILEEEAEKDAIERNSKFISLEYFNKLKELELQNPINFLTVYEKE